jgi:hypothetical protein
MVLDFRRASVTRRAKAIGGFMAPQLHHRGPSFDPLQPHGGPECSPDSCRSHKADERSLIADRWRPANG